MIYRGIAEGNTIELEESLPYPTGQPVSVSVEPLAAPLHPGSPAAIRQAMHEPPHLSREDVDELERVVEDNRLQVRQEGVFDERAQG